jgi:hypothetical protein
MFTRGQLAERCGLSSRLLGDLERGTRAVTARSLARMEPALGWEAGSARAVLDGAEPVLVEVPEPQVPPSTWMRAMSNAYLLAAELSDAGRTETAGSLVSKLGELAQHLSIGQTTHDQSAHDRPGTDTDAVTISGGHDKL